MLRIYYKHKLVEYLSYSIYRYSNSIKGEYDCDWKKIINLIVIPIQIIWKSYKFLASTLSRTEVNLLVFRNPIINSSSKIFPF